jgi:hypothetical protein
VPHARFHASGTHLDEHLVVTDRRPVDVTQLEHFGRAVHVLNDRPRVVAPGESGYWHTSSSGTPNTWAIRSGSAHRAELLVEVAVQLVVDAFREGH